MKKTIMIMILICLLLVPTLILAYDGSYDQLREQIEREIREEYENDEMFQKEVEEYGAEYGEEYIQKIVDREYKKRTQIQPFYIPDAKIVLYMRVIDQVLDYYCGPASVLQNFTTIGLYDKVSGTTDRAKLDTLAAEMGTAKGIGTYVYKVKDTLNNYISKYISSNEANYVYDEYSQETLIEFCDDVYHSLYNGYPPILHARTEYLSYYDGKASGHYISVYGIDLENDKAYLADPHYSSAYRGKHIVPVEEAYKSIHDTAGRYLITWL